MSDVDDGDSSPKINIGSLQKSLFTGPKGINILQMKPGGPPPKFKKNTAQDNEEKDEEVHEDETSRQFVLPAVVKATEVQEEPKENDLLSSVSEKQEGTLLQSVCKRRVKKQGARPPSRAFVRKSICLLDTEENVFSLDHITSVELNLEEKEKATSPSHETIDREIQNKTNTNETDDLTKECKEKKDNCLTRTGENWENIPSEKIPSIEKTVSEIEPTKQLLENEKEQGEKESQTTPKLVKSTSKEETVALSDTQSTFEPMEQPESGSNENLLSTKTTTTTTTTSDETNVIYKDAFKDEDLVKIIRQSDIKRTKDDDDKTNSTDDDLYMSRSALRKISQNNESSSTTNTRIKTDYSLSSYKPSRDLNGNYSSSSSRLTNDFSMNRSTSYTRQATETSSRKTRLTSETSTRSTSRLYNDPTTSRASSRLYSDPPQRSRGSTNTTSYSAATSLTSKLKDRFWRSKSSSTVREEARTTSIDNTYSRSRTQTVPEERKTFSSRLTSWSRW